MFDTGLMVLYEQLPFLAIGALQLGARQSENAGLCLPEHGVWLDEGGLCKALDATVCPETSVVCPEATVCPETSVVCPEATACPETTVCPTTVCPTTVCPSLSGALLLNARGETRHLGPGIHRYMGDRDNNGGRGGIFTDKTIRIIVSPGCQASLTNDSSGTGTDRGTLSAGTFEASSFAGGSESGGAESEFGPGRFGKSASYVHVQCT